MISGPKIVKVIYIKTHKFIATIFTVPVFGSRRLNRPNIVRTIARSIQTHSTCSMRAKSLPEWWEGRKNESNLTNCHQKSAQTKKNRGTQFMAIFYAIQNDRRKYDLQNIFLSKNTSYIVHTSCLPPLPHMYLSLPLLLLLLPIWHTRLSANGAAHNEKHSQEKPSS